MKKLFSFMFMAVAAVTFAFADEQEVESNNQYECGSTVQLTVNLSAGYHFVEWSDHNTDNPRTVSMDDNLEFEAIVEVDQYTIIFKNWDGKELKKETLDYGSAIVSPEETPTRPSTAKYSYTFKGWKPNIPSPAIVTDNATFVAEFDSTINKYEVEFRNYDGSILQSSEYEYGTVPTYTQTPTRPASAEFTYTFTGWDVTPVAVTGKATYTAQYTNTKNTYTITVLGENGEVTGSGTYSYGTKVTITATPNECYAFKGWNDLDINATREIVVEGTKTFTAKFEKIKYTLNVSVNDSNHGSVSVTVK